jgi:hypothetical protein
MKVISKRERPFQLGEKVVRGWEIELQPVEPDPEQDLLLAPILVTTFKPEIADRFQLLEDVPVTVEPGRKAAPKLVRVN